MERITPKTISDYFTKHYSYISHSLSDDELQEFINKHDKCSIAQMCDYLSDYLLSQGLADDIME